MDPIYHYLNRIVRVISAQGYIDDNTISGPGNDIEWVNGFKSATNVAEQQAFKLTPIPAGKQ